MQDSGKIFFVDEYDQQYYNDWITVDGVLNITSVTKTPYVWGESDSGYIKNNILYRKGIITVVRQLLKLIDSKYVIIAEGKDQYIDYFQTSFTCANLPKDTFKYHYNNNLADDSSAVIMSGSRFADPDEENDDLMIWGDIDNLGNATTTSVDGEILEFIDVWG